MSKFDFNITDLNPYLLERQIEKNVESIYSSPKAAKGRGREEIREAVSAGIPCEVALMQFHGCSDFHHRYGDVVSERGVKIECKASKYPWNEQKIKDMRDKIVSYNPADLIMFWQIAGDEYIFQGSIKMKD